MTSWQHLAIGPLQRFSEKYHLATLPSHAHQIIGAFAAYESILVVVAPWLSQIAAKNAYRSFPRRTQVNSNARIVSFVQATLISACALHVILTDSKRAHMTRDERLWSYSPEYGRVQAFAAGYFLWDVLVSTQYFSILGPTSLVHAIAALLVTMLGFRPFANFYGVNFVLYELSTPFLNIHWWLDKLNMTGTPLQLYNGLILLGSFFGCRLVWGTYQTINLSRDILSAWNENKSGSCYSPLVALENGILKPLLADHARGCSHEFPKTLLAVYLISNTVLSGLNFYWFGLMLKALRARFTTDSAKIKKKQ